MKGNKLRLYGIIAAAAVIGFSMASCGDGANGGGGGQGGIASFTVMYHRGNSGGGLAPARATARAGETITLPAAGRLTSPGTGYVLTWSTVNGEGGTLYPTNSSYRVDGNVTLYARWVRTQSITVTVTGFEATGWTNIRLYTPAGGQFIGNAAGAPISDSGEAVFNMNTIPGDFIVSLSTPGSFSFIEHRSVETVTITAGANDPIPFASLVLPPAISITGIPAGQWFVMTILMGTEIVAGTNWTTATDGIFTLRPSFSDGPLTGNLEVRLDFMDDTRHSISQTLNAGLNEIPFASFNEVPRGTATINVTGLSRYNGWGAEIVLGFGNNSPMGWAMVASGSASITINNVFPGTYDVFLVLFNEDDDELMFFAESRSIATTGTNNIPFSAFFPFDFDQDETEVIFTGNMNAIYMALVDPVTEATVADGGGSPVTTIEGAHLRFRLSDGSGAPAPTGSYLVVLYQQSPSNWFVSTAEITVTAGTATALDMSDFGPFTGFSAGLEPFERAMLRSRAGAEARALRARR